MKVVLANVFKEYVIKTDKLVKVSDIRLKIDGMLRTVEPIKIRLEKRNP